MGAVGRAGGHPILLASPPLAPSPGHWPDACAGNELSALLAAGGAGVSCIAITPAYSVRRERRHSLPQRVSPARQLSFQPVAIGADEGGNDIV